MLSKFILAGILVFCATFWSLPSRAADNAVAEQTHKISVGTGVRVRAAPSAQAAEVGKLRFGSDFTTTQRSAEKTTIGAQTDYWYRIEKPLTGWVFGGLLRAFDPKQADSQRLQLLREKLGAADHLHNYEQPSVLAFADAVEISEFAQRAAAASKTREVKGELELGYWRAVQIALFKIPMDKINKPPYRTYYQQLGKQAIYSEPSGEYLINPDSLWKLADRYKKDAIGDAIAWQAANAFVGGECEGFIGCVSARSLLMEGEYLKRYPKGRYVQAALQDVNEVLDYVRTEYNNQSEEGSELDLGAWQRVLAPIAASPSAKTARAHLNALQALQRKR